MRSLKHTISIIVLVTAAHTALASGVHAQELNLQSRLNTFTTPLDLKLDLNAATNKPRDTKGKKAGACMSTAVFLELIVDAWKPRLPQSIVKEYQTAKRAKDGYVNDATAEVIFKKIQIWATAPENRDVYQWLLHPVFEKKETKYALLLLPISVCDTKQPTTLKVTFPFNPSQETNALKVGHNPQADTALAFGGTVQLVTGGARSFDLMGISVGTASSRYDKFTSKSFDSLAIQGAYQFFLSAAAYTEGRSISEKTLDPPASGLITIDTLAIGFQEQKSYLPVFSKHTVDLFTPQLTLARQNIPLGIGGGNLCGGALPDFRKLAFCNYVDASFTLGHTFADVTTAENKNAALSVTFGRRFDQPEWKLTFPTTLTARDYDNVKGGRQDLQLQTGLNLSYAVPKVSQLGNAALSFSLPVNYVQNYSTLAKAEWHGIVVMPTVTLAFTEKDAR